MTLLPALATYLTGIGITGTISIGLVVDGEQASPWTLIQHVGDEGEDTTQTHLSPVVQITFRRSAQAAAHADAWTAYRALNTLRPLALTGSYTVSRSRCPAIPVPIGRDGRNLWGYALDVNFLLAYTAAI